MKVKQNLKPSKVGRFFFKFVEVDGREKPSEEGCLVIYLCAFFVFYKVAFKRSFVRVNLIHHICCLKQVKFIKVKYFQAFKNRLTMCSLVHYVLISS